MNAVTRRYMEHVGRDPSVTRRAMDRLLAEPVLQVIPFCGRLLSRPMLLPAPDRHQVEADLVAIHRLLASLPERLFGGDLRRYARAIGMDPAQTELAVRTATPWPPPLLARPDLYRDAGGFKLLELNLGSNLGGYQVAAVTRALLDVAEIRSFVEREELVALDVMEHVAAMLRGRLPAGGGRPVVAVADWPASYPRFEPMLRLIAAQLSGMGFDARPCHVGQLRAGGGGVGLDGERVDVVFRFFTLSEVTGEPEGPALLEPLLRAHEAGEVDMFVPLGTALLSSKRALALLGDERLHDAFTAAEHALIDRFLPWSRELRPGPVHAGGAEVELLDHCRSARERLILKPGLLLGGAGIHAGWTMSDGEWRARLADAAGGSYVVQERVVPELEPCPDPETGVLRPWVVNWGVFITELGYGGAFLRASSQPDAGVINFANGAFLGAGIHQEREPA